MILRYDKEELIGVSHQHAEREGSGGKGERGKKTHHQEELEDNESTCMQGIITMGYVRT